MNEGTVMPSHLRGKDQRAWASYVCPDAPLGEEVISLCREECVSISIWFWNISLPPHVEHVHSGLCFVSFCYFFGGWGGGVCRLPSWRHWSVDFCASLIFFFPHSFAVRAAFMSCALLCLYILYGYFILRLLWMTRMKGWLHLSHYFSLQWSLKFKR